MTRRVDRAPAAGGGKPGVVAAPHRIHTVLAARAAQRLVGHVLHAFRAARDEDVAHRAVLLDADARSVYEIAKAIRVLDPKLEQVGIAREGGRCRLLVARGRRLLMLALPVAFALRLGAAGGREQREKERAPQCRSAARAARTSGASLATARYCG